MCRFTLMYLCSLISHNTLIPSGLATVALCPFLSLAMLCQCNFVDAVASTENVFTFHHYQVNSYLCFRSQLKLKIP